MSRTIDLLHLGRPHVIAAYEVQGVVIDPGPESCLENLLAELTEEPRALLLTHIHLDHAGATGALCRRYPQLTVYVHERGAPHLVDPEKLLKSAARLYGNEMERLWGDVAPVPAERIQTLTGGETVEGMRVAYTPGHASHHVCYLDETSGHAYVGDMAGVRLPESPYTVAPTPPPDIDVEAWLDSADTIEGWGANALCLTHFGTHTDAWDQLVRLREALREEASEAEHSSPEEFAEWTEARTRERVGGPTADAYVQAAPPDQLGLGLRRYWDKKT